MVSPAIHTTEGGPNAPRPVTTGEQLRAARCLCGLTVRDLAHLARLAPVAVQAAEAQSGPFRPTDPAARAIRTALEGEGIEFIDDPARLGVVLRRR